MKAEIQELFDQGFSLLPLKGKQPLFKWEHLQHKKADAKIVKEWFAYENHNVGIICGKISGIVVLDIDPRNGGVVSDWLRRYPTDCFVVTGNGGAHLYYKHPGYQVENIHPAPGVDVKGDGGYVVAPPSIHPETNRAYVWMARGEPAPFPTEILTGVQDKEEKTSNSWISSLLEFGARDGEKNDSLASLTGFFASKEIPKDVTLSLVKLWNQRNTTKLDVKEIETSVNSVYKTAKRRSVVSEIPKQKEDAHSNFVGPKAFRLQGFEDYMHTYSDTPIDWLIPGWLPDKTINFVISAPGTYKTWLLLDLAVTVAMGGKFLGTVPCRMDGPVFLIQQEDHHGQTAERIEVIRQSKVSELMQDTPDVLTMDLPKAIPLYIHTDRQLRFDSKEAMDGLVENIEKIRPKLVIIDPLYSAASTDDYMAKSVEQMFILKELRDKFGVTFVIAHHTNKGGSEDRQRAWGSQFLNAFLETGWQLYPKGKTSIKVKRHFKSAGNPEETCLSFNINTTGQSFKYEVVQGLVDASNDEEEVLESEAMKVDEVDLRDLQEEPKASYMEELDRRNEKVEFNKIAPNKNTLKAIMEYLTVQTDYRAAREVADHLGVNLTELTKKLDALVHKDILKVKVDEAKRPGWKRWYKVKF